MAADPPSAQVEIEQQLLREPFNAALRSRYAQVLLETLQPEAALAQAELLCSQSVQDAPAHVLAARALQAMAQPEAALARYLRAGTLPGFVPDARLQSLLERAQSTATEAPRLQLVGSSARADVRAIQQVSADKVRFSSIVGMEDLKKTIRLKIIEPYLNPGLFARFRMQSGGGILLFGPPGCGKTMLARAVANECNAAFLSVGISDVLNMWMGESERNLAAMFDKARASAPTVLFFDELDALAFSRSKAATSSARTVVNEFLAQLDGMGRDNRGVLILAATNMPWDVDGAMKRPGRFSRQIFVPPPDAAARERMLQIKLTGVPVSAGLDLSAIARRAEHFSGADIDGLIEIAKECALEASLAGGERGVDPDDFAAAFDRMQPSSLDWLRTVRNVVKYAGDDGTYKDVERYLRQVRML
ncbi:MAG: AAA family ATPase [bacterium]|jgi:SpoVK/Ycf46/Vps4 family AAA+-type ATPase|nr:AAA family ATPase [Betaproteobacteria bacterium]